MRVNVKPRRMLKRISATLRWAESVTRACSFAVKNHGKFGLLYPIFLTACWAGKLDMNAALGGQGVTIPDETHHGSLLAGTYELWKCAATCRSLDSAMREPVGRLVLHTTPIRWEEARPQDAAMFRKYYWLTTRYGPLDACFEVSNLVASIRTSGLTSWREINPGSIEVGLYRSPDMNVTLLLELTDRGGVAVIRRSGFPGHDTGTPEFRVRRVGAAERERCTSILVSEPRQ
jgi:hypothetical protein